jgi:hypothetical protein
LVSIGVHWELRPPSWYFALPYLIGCCRERTHFGVKKQVANKASRRDGLRPLPGFTLPGVPAIPRLVARQPEHGMHRRNTNHRKVCAASIELSLSSDASYHAPALRRLAIDNGHCLVNHHAAAISVAAPPRTGTPWFCAQVAQVDSTSGRGNPLAYSDGR